MNNMGLGP
jgi:hypothetical protein